MQPTADEEQPIVWQYAALAQELSTSKADVYLRHAVVPVKDRELIRDRALWIAEVMLASPYRLGVCERKLPGGVTGRYDAVGLGVTQEEALERLEHALRTTKELGGKLV
jgi:hypothetical protein